MGFWHTGFIEHHEHSGLEVESTPLPTPVFICDLCGGIFQKESQLRTHRFETHSMNQPVLWLQGRKLGSNRACITRQLMPRDVHTEFCNQIIFNGNEIPINKLGTTSSLKVNKTKMQKRLRIKRTVRRIKTLLTKSM